MLLRSVIKSQLFKNSLCGCRVVLVQKQFMSQESEKKYSEVETQKILQVMNSTNPEDLSGYEITKSRLRKFSQWRAGNGQVKTLSDVELIDGFTDKTAKKLFDSILEGPKKKQNGALRIKGQILQPSLSEGVRKWINDLVKGAGSRWMRAAQDWLTWKSLGEAFVQQWTSSVDDHDNEILSSCKSVLAVYIAVNSVSWALINRTNYELMEWTYHSINYPDGKKLQITDILNIAWQVTNQLPAADIYVMKAEATTLRAAGSDPNNPKVIAVNLQKAQMVAMTVALLNARNNRFPSETSESESESEEEEVFNQKVYFLRPTLPYRLYGTLVGNEKVSTEQTVEMLLQNMTEKCTRNTHAYVPDNLQNMFKSKGDLQKDMLGHCLLLALTFMDICIYKNQDSINKLAKRGD